MVASYTPLSCSFSIPMSLVWPWRQVQYTVVRNSKVNICYIWGHFLDILMVNNKMTTASRFVPMF
jgi:hypothetical protein